MDPIESPCIDVCMLDDDDVCVGCQRTSHEIVNWVSMGPARRMRIMRRVGVVPEGESDSEC